MDLPEIPEVVGTPSMVLVKGVLSALLPPLELIGALPRMINPPHKPLSSLPRLLPVSFTEVKTMGLAAVPAALIFAPWVTIRAGAESAVPTSALMVVPASIVRVAPGSTKM